jgi:hypothetical protein
MMQKSADEINEAYKLNKRKPGGRVSPGIPARRAIGLGPDGTRTYVAVMERLTTSKETIEKHQRKLMRSCACLYFEINRYTVVLLNDK